MNTFMYYTLFVLCTTAIVKGGINKCDKKYFELSIYEDVDFLQRMIYSLVTDDRCGIAKIQVCPPSQSYARSDSQYFDPEYKNWTDEDDKNSFLQGSLNFKSRRSNTNIEENTTNVTSLSLPSDILALFDFFHAVSRYHNI